MDGFVWNYACLLITILYGVLIFSVTVKTQHVMPVVEFAVDSATALVGETINFQCTSGDFDSGQDLLEIRFKQEILMQFVNGQATYLNERSNMYYAAQVVTSGDDKSRIQLTINNVNGDDTGDYTCTIIKSSPEDMIISGTSTPIHLVVQLFSSPACLAGHHPDISYSTDTGQLTVTRSGISVSLICNVPTQSDDMSVIVEWSVSDGRMTEPGSYGSKSFTFISSQTDNGVDFTCTSSSPSVPDVAYQCKITVFTIDDLRITSTISNRVTTTISNRVTTTISNSVTTKPVPTTSTSDPVNLSTFTTKTVSKESTHAQPILTTMTTDSVTRQTVGINPKIPTTETVSNPTTLTTEAVSDLPLALIVGASGVTGLLLLILLVVIVCICVNKPSKRNRKRPSNADNVHLVIQRPSQGIDNLPRSAVGSFDSDIEVPLNGHHQSSTTYENTNRTLHNIEKESNQISPSLATKSSTPRINYENNENAHFVLPPLQESTRNSIANANGGIRNFVANKDAKDSRSNNLNSLGGKDHNSENVKDNNKENNQTVTPVQHSSSDAPLYADGNKNTNKSVSSSVSDVDSIPTYATVNRNRDRSGKVQSRVPPAVAVKNKGHKKGSLHYADVEFS